MCTGCAVVITGNKSQLFYLCKEIGRINKVFTLSYTLTKIDRITVTGTSIYAWKH